MYLGFGALLGWYRNGGINMADDDLDFCILADTVTTEQQNLYAWYLTGYRRTPTQTELEAVEYALIGRLEDSERDRCCFHYKRDVRRDQRTGRMWWLSCRRDKPMECWKCCHWFMWEYKGIMWHHKGEGAGERSLVKGCPADLAEIGDEVPYMGTTIHIPKHPGAILDFWYPDWASPRGGNSSKQFLMDVGSWEDEGSWKIKAAW